MADSNITLVKQIRAEPRSCNACLIQETAIIVPCYNEEKRIKADEFRNFASNHPHVSFIFVDDGSTDKTTQIINNICDFNPGQMLKMSLGSNRGKAEAVRQGFLTAINITSPIFKNIGYWDADLSTPLEAITKMAKRLEVPEALMVLGSRIMILSHRIKRKAARHYLGRTFATFASLVLNLQVYDTQCGAKIFKNIPELRTIFYRPFLTTWLFDVEILARYIVLGKLTGKWTVEDSAVEYPLETWTDIPGSKLKVKDFFLAPYELLKIFIFLRFPGKYKP